LTAHRPRSLFAIKAPYVSIAGCQTPSRKSFLMSDEIVTGVGGALQSNSVHSGSVNPFPSHAHARGIGPQGTQWFYFSAAWQRVARCLTNRRRRAERMIIVSARRPDKNNALSIGREASVAEHRNDPRFQALIDKYAANR